MEQEVGGSSPPNCTSKINRLTPALVLAASHKNPIGKRVGKLRQTIALPLHVIALFLDYASTALGRRAAWIAGDDWP